MHTKYTWNKDYFMVYIIWKPLVQGHYYLSRSFEKLDWIAGEAIT